MVLDLSINEEKSNFSTFMADAMAQAESELANLNETVYSIRKLKPDCDKTDYILAACSGALCGIVDVFLVGKPGESSLGKLTDKWFADRVMDFAKRCDPEHRTFDSLSLAIAFLEKKFKVPYDQRGCGDAGKAVFGLSPKNHHFKSLAHNPTLMGLFFSILDQFTNGSHFVSDGKVICLEKAEEGWELQGDTIPKKIFYGFVNWIVHLISDVSGSASSARKGNRGMGIPSPFLAWTNDLIVIITELGFSVPETVKSLNELALKVYEKGYDFRFQTTQMIPVIVNGLIVRFIYAVRRLFKYWSENPTSERSVELMWKRCSPFSNVTTERMLTVAHGTFCLIDIIDATGRAFVRGGGSFNAVEFVLRLNIIGIGTFAISLYGETKRVISYNRAKKDSDFAEKEIVIVKEYIEGLRILAKQYNDAYLLKFVSDLETSDAYMEAFKKSAELAKLRNVPENRILKSKSDIDKYFGGK